MNKDFNDMVMKFDNGDSFTIGETYEKVLNKLNACKEINFCSDIEVEDDELYGSSISFSTNNMIKDYLCNFVLGFENEKKLEDICVGFDIHDFIKRNGVKETDVAGFLNAFTLNDYLDRLMIL